MLKGIHFKIHNILKLTTVQKFVNHHSLGVNNSPRKAEITFKPFFYLLIYNQSPIFHTIVGETS